MAKDWYPVVNKDICDKCGECVKMCPGGVFDTGSPDKPVVVFEEGCMDQCHGCGDMCPTGAITYYGDNTGWTPPNSN